MKITDLAKGKFIAIKNEVEGKDSILEVERIEHLYRNEMIHDSDGWETGRFNTITLGYIVHFTSGYKKRYNDLMDINFTEKTMDVCLQKEQEQWMYEYINVHFVD